MRETNAFGHFRTYSGAEKIEPRMDMDIHECLCTGLCTRPHCYAKRCRQAVSFYMDGEDSQDAYVLVIGY